MKSNFLSMIGDAVKARHKANAGTKTGGKSSGGHAAGGGGGQEQKYCAGRKRGRHFERKRIKSILNLPEAKGRESAALEMATTTSLKPSIVAQYLREIPRRSRLAEVMAGVPNPDVGADLDPAEYAEQTPGKRLLGACKKRRAEIMADVPNRDVGADLDSAAAAEQTPGKRLFAACKHRAAKEPAACGLAT